MFSTDHDDTSLFHGSLFLLSLLGPLQKALRPVKVVELSAKTREKEWEKFLDHLCLLIDCGNAGSTVTSIAVEKLPCGSPKYWLAVNHGARTDLVELLEWILQELQIHNHDQNDDIATIKACISRQVISQATTKIVPYRKRLAGYLKDLRSCCEDSHESCMSPRLEDLYLLQYLEQNLAEENDEWSICMAMFRVRMSGHLTQLEYNAYNNTDHNELWKSIRHHVGRLGSWIKATHVVVDYHDKYPSVTCNFEIESVSEWQLRERLNLDSYPTLKQILVYIAPTYNPVLLLDKLNTLYASHSGTFSDLFAEKAENLKPYRYVHAEVALLEHFLEHGLNYWGPSKYIACSKHSCYCCSRYLQYRTKGELLRPSHENAWYHWSFPTQTGTYHQDNEIFKHISDSIRREIVDRIIRSDMWGKKYPDSTTGISASTTHF